VKAAVLQRAVVQPRALVEFPDLGARINRRAFLAALALVLVALAASGSAASATSALDQPAAAEQSFVLRAGANFQRVGGFTVRRDPTYRGAIRAFGEASRCRLVRGPAFVEASWRPLGLAILLATYGLLPDGETGCTAPASIHISSIHITGTRWYTAAGLKVGQTGRRVSELYPRAIFNRRQRAWWLVHVRQRCVIGACQREFETVPRLIAKMRNGRVASLVFPVGAEGE
jgi:hypothetical protein